MTRSSMIRDPVHGYLRVAAHERRIVDHPVTQRLRHIAQHGLAQYVFPEARTSRFAHSIGAMHVASRFVVSAIENAKEDDTLAFFGEFENEFPDVKKFIGAGEVEDLLLMEASTYGSGLLAGRVVFRTTKLRDRKYRSHLGIIEAGTRLAALFHDLGHFPFSHDLEFALQDYVASRESDSDEEVAALRKLVADTPHEVVGHAVARLVLVSLLRGTNAIERVAYELALKILDAVPPYYESATPASPIDWLHSLIDGEIDADRADYLLRDARALGFEFAFYDLERLIANLALAVHPKHGFVTAVDEHALASVESFIVSRARSTQSLVRHHKVTQIGAALRHASVAVLRRDIVGEFRRDISSLGGEIEDPDTAERVLKRFAIYDDAWWMTQLRTFQADLAAKDPLLEACLDLVLSRASRLKSLWKRKGDLSADETSLINSLVASDVKAIRGKIGNKGLLLAIHKFVPYKSPHEGQPVRDSIIMIRTGKGELRMLSELSPLVRSLYESWMDDPHVFAFALRDGTTLAVDRLEVLTLMRSAVE